MKLSESLARHRWKIMIFVVIAALVAWYVQGHHQDWSREKVMAYGKSLPVFWFLLAFLVLPLVGFPVSILLVLLGIRFGLGWGMVIAAVVMAAHNIAAYFLTHGWFRDRLRNRLKRSGHEIPRIDENRRVWFTMLFAAVHGPPYAMKLYLLALTDVPFRVYFWAGAPVYIFFCVIPVAAGSAVMSFDPTWIYVLVTAMAIVTFGGYWLKKRYGKSTEA